LTKGIVLPFYVLPLIVRDKQYKITGIEVLEANLSFLQFTCPSFGVCKGAARWKKIYHQGIFTGADVKPQVRNLVATG
jgi:hypothetical protein